MSLHHSRSRHWWTLRSRADLRCARCGLPIEHRASAAPYYGSAASVGPMVTPRMSGGSCCCVQPEAIVADSTGVPTG